VELKSGTYAFGCAFEHFIIEEIQRLSSYANNDWQMFYLQTNTGTEIDLVIDRPGTRKAIIEIKSTDHIAERDTAELTRFYRDMSPCEAFCLSRDKNAKKIGPVWCLPWPEGIKKLGL
jgi:predicted AAA+ superfamily ATPase